MLLLLSKGQKDTLIAINNIKEDLSIDHDVIRNRIKRFFVEIKGLNTLLLIIRDKRVSTKFTCKTVDIITMLINNGEYFNTLIEVLSENNNFMVCYNLLYINPFNR